MRVTLEHLSVRPQMTAVIEILSTDEEFYDVVKDNLPQRASRLCAAEA